MSGERRLFRPAPYVEPRPFDVWTRANAGEVLPGMIAPLTWSTIGAALNDWFQRSLTELGFRDARGVAFATLYQGRLYFNVGAMYHYYVKEGGMPSRAVLQPFGGPGADHGLPFPDQGVRWRKMLRLLPAMSRQSRRQQRAPEMLRASIPLAEDAARRLASLDLESMSLQELFEAEVDATGRLEPFYQVFNDCNGAAFAAYGALSYLLEQWAGDASLANDLVGGLEMTKTAEGSAELWRIARKAAARADVRSLVARSSPVTMLDDLAAHPAGAPIASDLCHFLSMFGHRAADELDIANPRWAEDPAPLLAIFKSYVVSPPRGGPSDVAERQRQAREAAEARVDALLRRRLADRLLPWKRLVLQSYIRQAQTFVPLREDPKFYLLKVMLPLRRCHLEIGRRLTAAGLLGAPEHVFYIEAEELEGACTQPRPDPALGDRVRERLAQYERWSHLPVPWALDAEKRPIPERTPARPDGRLLRGLPASSGRVTARARVITDLRQADEMRRGEILVAPFTDPGWTPLFPLSAAIVTDLGGLLSHGAVVAREYGVPAVVNTAVATAVIRTGDLVTVDGSAGTVLIEAGEG
jgi:phosphohistidine swiveling domain-containing protein